MGPVDNPALPRTEFERYVQRHEADENAHGAERHRQNDDWNSILVNLQRGQAELQSRMNAHDIAHAGSSGELRGIKIALGWGFGVITTLLLTFGGTVLYLLYAGSTGGAKP